MQHLDVENIELRLDADSPSFYEAQAINYSKLREEVIKYKTFIGIYLTKTSGDNEKT